MDTRPLCPASIWDARRDRRTRAARCPRACWPSSVGHPSLLRYRARTTQARDQALGRPPVIRVQPVGYEVLELEMVAILTREAQALGQRLPLEGAHHLGRLREPGCAPSPGEGTKVLLRRRDAADEPHSHRLGRGDEAARRKQLERPGGPEETHQVD